jgi:outer membrane PBP1 activator LpoA protein
LHKEAVEVLAQAGSLPVPVLALNQVDSVAAYSDALYQFGLSPEDEAREAAQRAWRDGHTRALAFMPQGNWGERVFTAFNDEWQKLGGTLLDMAYYNPDDPDHGKQISALLNLDLSKARHLKLVRRLGQHLEFEPRRRMDVDFIFLLARPGQARLIRPQFSFHRASRVPIYATSHVYTGSPDKARDIDLNGILFCDTPWTLDKSSSWQHIKQSINTQWPESARKYSRLYAMGIDAWQIIPYLGQLGSGMFNEYPGVTGNLILDNERRLHRELRWARFRNGLPQVEQPGTAEVEKQATAF